MTLCNEFEKSQKQKYEIQPICSHDEIDLLTKFELRLKSIQLR